ncbi:MAG: hypothetical protein B7O98_03805 [Zestosphaera tikiterensis]|uniref:Uncharacterized protein n=1 Tax=Zestosphaera tikiterensis TaxID=1973259 RepID=A0A2R7Y7N6_9CREN|nr:MAG: hypothetical protein B7O98_03805 [Zestosphaera tikiterensis]
MEVEGLHKLRKRVSAIALLTLLCFTYLSALKVVSEDPLNKVLQFLNDELIITYRVKRTLTISNLSGSPASITVSQEFMFDVRPYNSTHVTLIAGLYPNSTISVDVGSSSWITLGGVLSWITSNYTDFVIKNMLPTIKAVVTYNDFNRLAKETIGIQLFMDKPTTASCSTLRIGDGLFNVFTVVLEDGVAYYECEFNLLLKFQRVRSARLTQATGVVDVVDVVESNIEKANTQLLTKILISSNAQNIFGVELLLIIAVTLVGVSTTVTVLTVLKRFRNR